MQRTEPAPETFDLDAWLAGATRVTKAVEVFGRAHLQAEIDELDSLAQDAGDAERVELLARAEALRGEMLASRVRFKVTSIPVEREEALRRKHEKDPDGYVSAVLAEQIVQPAGMTPQKVLQLRDAIGDGYFAQTILAAAAAAQQGMAVTVPFSSAASRDRRR